MGYHGDDVPAIQVDRRDFEPDHQEQHGIQDLLDEALEGHEMLLGRASTRPRAVGPTQGERISSCLATVNAVISKRFAKRHQMQWTKRGAHLLRQIRGHSTALFERWYPG
jgi:hypothetical protein